MRANSKCGWMGWMVDSSMNLILPKTFEIQFQSEICVQIKSDSPIRMKYFFHFREMIFAQTKQLQYTSLQSNPIHSINQQRAIKFQQIYSNRCLSIFQKSLYSNCIHMINTYHSLSSKNTCNIVARLKFPFFSISISCLNSGPLERLAAKLNMHFTFSSQPN